MIECIHCKKLIKGSPQEYQLYKFYKGDKSVRVAAPKPIICINCFYSMSKDDFIQEITKIIEWYKKDKSTFPTSTYSYWCDSCYYYRDTKNLNKCKLCADGKFGWEKSYNKIIDEIYHAFVEERGYGPALDWLGQYILKWENIKYKNKLSYNATKYWSRRR